MRREGEKNVETNNKTGEGISEGQMSASKVKNKGLWKKFFHLVRLAKVPWFGVLIYLAVSMSTVYIAVRLPQVDADIYSGNASVENVIWVIVVNLVSAFLVSVMTAAYGIIGGRIDRNFRDAIWNKILHLEPKYFDQIEPNTLLSRLTDDAESMKEFILLLVSEITGIATTVATIAAMSTMNKGLAVIMVIFIPIVMAFGFLLGRLKLKYGNSVKFQMAKLTDYLSGQLARIMVIKAYNRQEYESRRGEEEINAYYIADRQVQVADFLRYTVGSVISIAPNLALLLAGIYMLENKYLTPAGWIVFYAYANELFVFFTGKTDTWISVKEYQGRLNRLSELFDTPDEKRHTWKEETVEPGDIVFEDVTFSYGKGEILSHVSLTIPGRRLTVIVGPSGTGKTTILKLIERIYEPVSGKVLLNGCDITDYKLENLRRQIAYVRQDTPMISGTIRDNILYGVEETYTDEEILSAAEEIRAARFIRECPGGLDYEVGQFGSKLSGGQKQKVSVLRAFLQKREYILLDEPTASLDAISSYEVGECVRQLAGKRTVIMVAHDGKLIQNDGDSHIIVVENSRTIREGTAGELFRSCGFFRKMVYDGEEEAAHAEC